MRAAAVLRNAAKAKPMSADHTQYHLAPTVRIPRAPMLNLGCVDSSLRLGQGVEGYSYTNESRE